MKKLFSVLLALTLLLSLGLTAFADTVSADDMVYAEEDGYINILFSNGYRGFCIDYGLEDATKGDSFTEKGTTAAKNNDDNTLIGEYLKMMFVEGFDTLFTVDNANLTASLKQPLQVQKNVWYFSDRYAYGIDRNFLDNFKNLVKAGYTVPDHGHVKKINDTTLATFDFLVMQTSKTGQQSFFGYKVTLSPLPKPEIITPASDTVITLAEGKSAELSVTATNAESYQWQVDKGNGFEDISGATNTALTVDAVTDENADYRYRCVAQNTAGRDTSPIFTFNMIKAPVITSPTTDTAISVYPGDSLSFTITATNEPEYQWQVDEGNGFIDIAGATEPTFKPPFPDGSNAGYKYRCIATNIAGSDTSPVFTAVKKPAPVFERPEDEEAVTRYRGEDLTLEASAKNAASYQWQMDEGNGFEDISGATDETLNLSDLSASMDGAKFRCTATNPSGSAESFVFTLKVIDKPVFITPDEDKPFEVDEKASALLTAEAENALSYQWQVDKGDGFENIDGATDSTYTIPTAEEEHNGYKYRCVATNPAGSAESFIFTQKVRNIDPPVITEGKDDSSAEAENGEEVKLKVEAEDGSDYQWQILTEDGFKDIDGATDPEYTVPTDKDGENEYRCVISNENGDVTSGTFTVVVSTPEEPEPSEPGDSTPETGDGFSSAFWLCLLFASLLSLGATVTCIKKKSDK